MIPFRDDNPRSRFPYVTIGLIAMNVLVFLYQFWLEVSEGPAAINTFISSFALIPYQVVSFDPSSFTDFITSMFMHGGWMHIIGNMVYLWVFGDNIEDKLGPILYLWFYIVCGLLADFAHILVDPGSQVPTLGASGAIAGVLGAYLVLFPQARVQTLVFMFRWVRVTYVPALYLLGFWFVLQLLPGFLSIGSEGGGVAYFAHIGGFLAGALGMFWWAKINSWPTFLDQPGGLFGGLFGGGNRPGGTSGGQF